MATATTEKKTQTIVPPFGIEIDTPRNGDVIIQNIPGCRIRGAVDSSKPVRNRKGDLVLPIDQVRSLGSLPHIPGQQIHVNPEKLTYTIVDPLRKNEELCKRIHTQLKTTRPMGIGDKIGGVPTKKGTLDVHRMKGLCRELIWLLDSDHAKMAKGPQPSLEDVNDLPGNYLQNPGSQVNNMQPRYERDFEAWVARLGAMGG